MAMSEDYTSDGTTFHDTLELVLDGEVASFETLWKSVVPKRGAIAKLLDNATYVKQKIIGNNPGQLGSTGTPDGASLVGVAAISAISWAGGNLRALLAALGDAINKEKTTNGGTLPAANTTITLGMLPSRRVHFRVPALTTSYEYTLPAAESGQVVSFRMIGNPPNTVTIKKTNGDVIAVMTGKYRYDGSTTVPWYSFAECTLLGSEWVLTGGSFTDPISPAVVDIGTA